MAAEAETNAGPGVTDGGAHNCVGSASTTGEASTHVKGATTLNAESIVGECMRKSSHRTSSSCSSPPRTQLCAPQMGIDAENTALPAERASSSRVQDNRSEFGWEYVVDNERNHAYYVHTHTGEVKWPTTTPSFFHESEAINQDLDLLHAQQGASSQLVLLPSGLVPLSSTALAVGPMRPKNARHPVWWSGLDIYPHWQCSFQDNDAQRTRLLPPTWEASQHGYPFLAAFPARIVTTSWSEMTFCGALRDSPNRYTPTGRTGISSAFQTQTHNQHCRQARRNLTGDCPEYVGPLALRSPHENLQKEHNRRGYSLRQTRKLMRRLGIDLQKSKEQRSPKASNSLRSHNGDFSVITA